MKTNSRSGPGLTTASRLRPFDGAGWTHADHKQPVIGADWQRASEGLLCEAQRSQTPVVEMKTAAKTARHWSEPAHSTRSCSGANLGESPQS